MLWRDELVKFAEESKAAGHRSRRCLQHGPARLRRATKDDRGEPVSHAGSGGVVTTQSKTESTDRWYRSFVAVGVMTAHRDRHVVRLGSKTAQRGKGVDWHPRSLFVEHRESGLFRYPIWLSALLLDHDARRIEIADLVD